MEADRSGGGPNSGGGGSCGGVGAGRNPNGPKAAPGQMTAAPATGPIMAAVAAAAAAGAAPGGGSLQPRDTQDGDSSGMTLPGILHFIQYEWGRFQAEKYRWEAERDELRVNLFIYVKIKTKCFVLLSQNEASTEITRANSPVSVHIPNNQCQRGQHANELALTHIVPTGRLYYRLINESVAAVHDQINKI